MYVCLGLSAGARLYFGMFKCGEVSIKPCEACCRVFSDSMLSNEAVITVHYVPTRIPCPHPSAFQTPYSPLFSSLLCLFFLRTLGRAPGSPAAEALFHRPQYWPPVLFGHCFCPPPPSVLLPSPPLPQLVNLWPGATRVPLRSALGRSLRAVTAVMAATTAALALLYIASAVWSMLVFFGKSSLQWQLIIIFLQLIKMYVGCLF